MPDIPWYPLFERALCLAVGLLVGYGLGIYRERIRQQRTLSTNSEPQMQESKKTFLHRFTFSDVLMTVVVVIVCVSVFASQRAWNESNSAAVEAKAAVARVAEQQKVRDAENQCVSQVLFATIQALNERTTFTQDQADANVALIRAQAELLNFFLNSGAITEAESRAATQRYFQALHSFIDLADKTKNKQSEYAYPTEEQFLTCLQQARIIKE